MKRYLKTTFPVLILCLAVLAVSNAAAQCENYDMNSEIDADVPAVSVNALAVAGDLMVGAQYPGLVILDNSNGEAEPVGSLSVAETVTSVTINGSYVYATYAKRLLVVDLSDPTSPTVVDDLPNNAFYDEALLDGQFLWLSSRGRDGTNSSVRVWDVSQPEAPSTPYTAMDLPRSVSAMAIGGDYIYIVRNSSLPAGSCIYAFHRDPSRNDLAWGRIYPQAVLTHFLPGGDQPAGILGLSSNDRYLYVSVRYQAGHESTFGIVPLDLSNPLDPVPVATGIIDSELWTRALLADGNFLYAFQTDGAGNNRGLRLLDVGETSTPLVRAVLDTPFPCAWAQVHEGRVFGLSSSISRFYSFAPQCDAPAVIDNSWSAWMERGEDATINYWHFEWYTEHWTDPLFDVVLVVDDPAAAPACYRGAIRRAGEDEGVQSSVGFEAGLGYRHHIIFNSGSCAQDCTYSWAAASVRHGQAAYTDFAVLSVHCQSDDGTYFEEGFPIESMSELPAGPIVDSIYPNPFNPTTTIRYYVPERTMSATLAIFDVSGKRVRTLDGNSSAGWNEVTWYGRDDSGRAVGSGTYFVQLRADGALVASQRVTMLK